MISPRLGRQFFFALVLFGTCMPSAGQKRTPQKAAEGPPTTNQNARRRIELQDFRPRPMLVVKSSNLTSAKFPVVNVHTHLNRRMRNSQPALADYVGLMDRCGIAVSVNLDCTLGADFDESSGYAWQKYRDRVVQFVNINWIGDGKREEPGSWDCHRPDFARRICRQLDEAVKKGASGLKLFKSFGLKYRNADGSLVQIDDPRWDPIWKKCGELRIPVIMHTADPVAFFEPVDETNERYEELSRHPDWSFFGDSFPSHAELIAARNRIIARHPETKFIGAHLANYPEDLEAVGRWLDQYPNLYVEIASRIGELGRKPYSARKFFIEHSDRILFGTDGPKPEPRMHLYFRFLESYDEYFPYSEQAFPPQGFWNIYGLGLPDDVLRKVYFENAVRLIPGVKERLDLWKLK